ncbi:MAG TPA: hypothetical protein VGA69_08965 [Nitriliruptorales bacterium]
MDELLTDTPAEVAGLDLPSPRPCTRCDGQQHLVVEVAGMGKYRCDVCEMVVGFDVRGDPAEFLINRGLPSRYTKATFGTELLVPERRLTPSSPELTTQD